MFKAMMRLALCGAFAIPAWQMAAADNLTDATKEMLESLKIGPEVMNGLDAELAVPQEWLDKAKAEGAVSVRLTMDESHFVQLQKLFETRYPGVKIEYARGLGAGRAVQPLMAFKRGTYLADIISSFETLVTDFEEVDALVTLKGTLPAYDGARAEFTSPNGNGAPWRLTPYCMSYNKNKVKVEELPKTWDDLVNDPRWQNQNVGMARNFNTWIPHLTIFYGKEWGDKFIDKIFTQLKPQYRKENLGMLPKLTSLGEFDLSVPSGDGQVAQWEKEGAPVGYYCPDVVPFQASWVGILKGNPHPYASLLFTNWLLSREGQLAVWWADFATNSHKDLQAFMFYPDQVKGKKIAPLNHEALALMPEIAAVWAKRWEESGGPAEESGGGGGGN